MRLIRKPPRDGSTPSREREERPFLEVKMQVVGMREGGLEAEAEAGAGVWVEVQGTWLQVQLRKRFLQLTRLQGSA
jgi:hypothetical protein